MINTIDLTPYDVISFDVFDTLIHRRIDKPTDLFKLLAAHPAAASALERNSIKVEDFKSHRVTAESQARARKFATAKTHEIFIEDIYSQLVEQGILTSSEAEEIMAAEIDLEIKAAYANPTMLALYEKAKAAEKIVIICSDMYLHAETILRLIEICGYPSPDNHFVSCELGLSKHEGTVFPYVLQTLGVKRDRVLHLGDNPHSDIRQASAHGIETIQVNVEHLSFAPHSRFVAHKGIETTVAPVHNGIAKSLLFSRANAETESYRAIGHSVFAPAIFGFFLWLEKKLKDAPVATTLFMARDAQIMHDFSYGNSDFGQRAYCYASRASLLQASMSTVDDPRLKGLFYGRSRKSYKDHLKDIGLSTERMRLKDFRDLGIHDLDAYAPNSDKKLLELVKHYSAEFLEVAAKKRRIAGIYLGELVENSGRIALIDCGWSGGTQESIRKILSLECGLSPLIDGYYFGTQPDAGSVENECSRHHGYLFKNGLPSEIYKPFIRGGTELLELALRAPHGSTLGYELSGSKATPVIEERASTANNQFADEVHEGVRDFFQEAILLFGRVERAHFDSTEWAQPFLQLLRSPSYVAAMLLGPLEHSDVVGRDRTGRQLAPFVSSSSLRFLSRKYQIARKHAYWTAGFLKLNSKKS